MIRVKIRKKARMSTKSNGRGMWDEAEFYGAKSQAVRFTGERRKGSAKRARHRREQDAILRVQEAYRQQADSGLNWDKVAILLRAGYSLELAKEVVKDATS